MESFITPPPEDEDNRGDGLVTESMDLEPDSMELLMWDVSESLSRPIRPPAFYCDGRIETHDPPQFGAESYVQPGHLHRLCQQNLASFPTEQTSSIRLFEHDYLLTDLDDPRSCALNHFVQHFDELQDSVTQNRRMWLETPDYRDYTDVAASVRAFLAWVRWSACEVARRPASTASVGHWLTILKTIHNRVVPVSEWPPLIIAGQAAQDESASPIAAVFHLALDCLWTVYSSLKVLSRGKSEGGMSGVRFCHFSGVVVPPWPPSSDVNPEMAALKTEVAYRIMCDLVYLFYDRFRRFDLHSAIKTEDTRVRLKYFNYSIFNCTCIRELLLMMFHSEYGGRIEELWTAILAATVRLVEHEEPTNPLTPIDLDLITIERLSVMAEGSSRAFYWWVLAHLGTILDLEDEGRTRDVSEQTTALTRLIDKRLKSSLYQTECSEIELRTILWTLIGLSELTGPNLSILNLLWDYFHRRLNSTFQVKTASVASLAILPRSIEEFYARIPKLPDSQEHREKVQRPEKSETSYQTFLRLLQTYLQSAQNRSPEDLTKLRGKIFGRVLAKLPGKRLQELDEIGWRNLIALLISLFSCSGGEQTMGRIHGLLTTLPFDVLLLKNKVIFLIGVGVLARLALDKGLHAQRLVEILMTGINSAIEGYQGNRGNFNLARLAQHCMEIWGQFLEFGLASPKSDLIVGQSELISGQIGSYLKFCTSTELQTVMNQLSALVMKIRRYFNSLDERNIFSLTEEEVQTKERVSRTLNGLWTRIFPVVQRDLASSLTGPHHTMAEFTVCMLLMHMQDQVPEGVALEAFPRLFQLFTTSGTVHPEFSCSFLLNFLESSPNNLTQEIVECIIKGWMRCGLQIPKDSSSIGIFVNLSQAVYLLPPFEQIRPFLENGEDHVLERFFVALGKLIGANLDAIASLRATHLPYLLVVVDCLPVIKKLDKHSSQLDHFYDMASSLVENCISLIYDFQSRAFNHLGPILNELFIPNVIQNPDYNLPEANKVAIQKNLPRVIYGLVSVGVFKKDAFIVRTIKSMATAYMIRFKVENPLDNPLKVSQHPLFRCFTNFIPADARSDLQKQLLMILKTEFIQSRNQVKSYVSINKVIFNFVALVLDSFTGTTSTFVLVIRILNFPIFEAAVKHKDLRHPGFKLLQRLWERTKASSASLLDTLKQENLTIVDSLLGYVSNAEFFDLLCDLTPSYPAMSQSLMDAIGTKVALIEGQRGFSSSIGHSMRTGLNRLQQAISRGSLSNK